MVRYKVSRRQDYSCSGRRPEGARTQWECAWGVGFGVPGGGLQLESLFAFAKFATPLLEFALWRLHFCKGALEGED